MIHMTTGNRLDVVYDYDESGKRIIKGLRPWGGELIPLPDPGGLLSSLRTIIEECKRRK
jgi:hypothetical protein